MTTLLSRKPIGRLAFLLIPLLLACFVLSPLPKALAAQQASVQTSALIARNMKDYAKTPQGIKRKEKYKNTYSTQPATKDIKYKDGTTLHLKMSPKFGDLQPGIKARLEDVDKKVKPDHSTDSKGQQWTCSTEHINLTATSTTFLNNDYSSAASHIYPGACYTFENFNNGSYKEQTGDRNPLTIVTDNTNIKGSSFVTVKDPNMATIRNAVDDLFREAKGPAAAESFAHQTYRNLNDADQSLKISGGASGYGATLTASYGTGSQSKTVNLTIDAIKTLFSINTIPPDNGFFTDTNVEATPYLQVIGSVSYGVRILANLTATFNSQDEAAAFAASYSGFGVSANVNFSDISKNTAFSSTINGYVVGGPGNSTVSFNKKDLEKEINKIMAGATYKNAMPVKYEFYDMAGDVVGSNSATDSFAVRNCTPGKDDPRLESAYVQFQTGDDGKNATTNYTLLLYPGNVNLNVNKELGDMVYEFNEYGSIEGPLEYQGKTSYSVKLWGVNKPATLSEFTKNGGALMLTEFPQGDDTWQNSVVTLTLNFAGGAGPSTPIHWSNINIDQNFRTRILYFDGSFKPK